MKPFSIVITVDVLEQSEPNLLNIFERSVLSEPLLFQFPPETFTGSVVPAIAFPAHALSDSEPLQRLTEFIRCILNTSIAVKKDILGNDVLVVSHRLFQGVYNQFRSHMWSNDPAEDLSGMQINDRGKIKRLTIFHRDIGDVGQPFLVRSGRSEIPVQDVPVDMVRMRRIRGLRFKAPLFKGATADSKFPAEFAGQS